MSAPLDELLPSGYKRLNRIPLTVDVIAVTDPCKGPTDSVYCGLRPFVMSTFKRSLPGVRANVYTCLLLLSSN